MHGPIKRLARAVTAVSIVTAWLGMATVGVSSAASLDIVSGELTQKVLTEGSVRVIVHLYVPFAPEAELGDAASASTQRRDIDDAQARVLAALRGHVHGVRHRYATVPLLALHVGPHALQALANLPGLVHRVVEDRPLPVNLAESVPLVHAPAAWGSGFDGTGQVIAVIDTGVDKTHPFLSGKVVDEACFAAGSDGLQGAGDCPNGLSSQTGTGAAVPCTFALSACTHGTHVAGIAAGSVSSFSGVARGAKVMAIRVFSKYTGSECQRAGEREDPCALANTSDQIAALEHVYEQRGTRKIAAVNMSLGGGRYTSSCDNNPDVPHKPIIDNLRAAGIATVISAGNNRYRDALGEPACISTAISVGSTDDGSDGTIADEVSVFSNSASFLKLLAPGAVIVSSIPGGDFDAKSGTSMAAPHVAGAWAVIKQKVPTATVGQVLFALQHSGLPITDPKNGITTPRIRINEALSVFPDLVVTAVSNPPGAGPRGGSFSVTDTTKNQGLASAAASTTRYYLSTDGVKGPGDLLLTTVRAVPALGAGSSHTGTVKLTIPSTTPLGTYVLLACADDLGVVAETQNNNNCTASAGTVAVTQPDLQATAVSNPPAVAIPGTSFPVTDTIKNLGVVTSAASKTSYYLVPTTDPRFHIPTVTLTGNRSIPGLAAGASNTGSVTVTIPATTRLLSYVLMACADGPRALAETNEDNNCITSTATITISRPDLIVTAVSDPPALAGVGTSFTVTTAVQNTELASAKASTTRYYLSLDTIKTSADIRLSGALAVPALAGVGTFTGTATVTIPSGTPLGAYFVLACADDLGTVSEINEGQSNCMSSAGKVQVTLPDLVITAGAHPTVITRGSSFQVTDTSTNQGLVSVGTSTTAYYLQQASGDLVVFTLIKTRPVPALAAGASDTATVSVTVPVTAITAGTAVFTTCADHGNVRPETNEANNCVDRGTVTLK
jgi:subtilisin family serine protease